ncbi:MAG: type III pantothenate kinase [Defluviitaleaceae bacterium]|nr:type III pantothenate kinase [Defluviitaleaceae bacterium]
MKLGISIGNTNISIGYYENNKLITEQFLHEDYKKIAKYKFENTKNILNSQKAIIASVVPDITEKVIQIFENYTFITPSIKTTYKIAGIDRLLSCEIALKKYTPPLIVIDTGTAITINVINKEGTFLGGSILPGFQLSLNSLSNLSLLPNLKIEEESPPLIGTNTKEAMLSGVIHGIASCIKSMVSKIEKEIGNCKVLITGGGSKVLMKHIDIQVKYEENLLMEAILNLPA